MIKLNKNAFYLVTAIGMGAVDAERLTAELKKEGVNCKVVTKAITVHEFN